MLSIFLPLDKWLLKPSYWALNYNGCFWKQIGSASNGKINAFLLSCLYVDSVYTDNLRSMGSMLLWTLGFNFLFNLWNSNQVLKTIESLALSLTNSAFLRMLVIAFSLIWFRSAPSLLTFYLCHIHTNRNNDIVKFSGLNLGILLLLSKSPAALIISMRKHI